MTIRVVCSAEGSTIAHRTHSARGSKACPFWGLVTGMLLGGGDAHGSLLSQNLVEGEFKMLQAACLSPDFHPRAAPGPVREGDGDLATEPPGSPFPGKPHVSMQSREVKQCC